MKKRNYISLLLVCVFLLSAALSGCGKAPSNTAAEEQPKADSTEITQQAAPQAAPAEQALLAYREILKGAPALEGEHPELSDASFGYEQNLEKFGDHIDLFALADLDRNGIPELLTLSAVNFRWTILSLYTYADGEAVLLKDPAAPEVPGTLDQNSSANGAYIAYFCEENHIHSVWHGMTPMGEAEENHAYAFDGTALTEVSCDAAESDHTVSLFNMITIVNTAENADMLMP